MKKAGQTLVEYGVVLALMAVLLVVMLLALGRRTCNAVAQAANDLGAVTEQSEETLHVGGIDLDTHVAPAWVRIDGIVWVVDENGLGVGGATVDAAWSVNGTPTESGSDGTDGQGRARFSFRSGQLSSGDVVRLAVSGVTATGYDYDSGSNEESSDEIAVP